MLSKCFWSSKGSIPISLECFCCLQADKVDAYLHAISLQMESGRSHLACLGTWVLLHTLRTMIQYLFSGFELTLYSTYEYHYIFWWVGPAARLPLLSSYFNTELFFFCFPLSFIGIFTSFCTVGSSLLTTELNAFWMNTIQPWNCWRARTKGREPARKEAKVATASLKGRRRKATHDLTLKKSPIVKQCRACVVDIIK